MKRLLAGLFLAALALSACSNGTPTTTLNGQLSANTRAQAEVAARKGTNTTKASGPGTTRRPTHTTRTSRPTNTSVALPTVPSTPTTISQSGVAGAVLYQTNCAADRPCSLAPGPARVDVLGAKDKVVASGHATDHGAFIIPLAPGSYTLVATPPVKKEHCAPVPVTVEAGKYTTVQIQCTGK